ncbi:MAG: alanine dehydrogenase [Chromatiales bacterium 21-64-14]|nr:MAG: alanine dehydrogenase [Chromatiales bacterium 21-64-14]HQU16417.1 alanine dehydrogenase [Gammaproteobacteria bacterium]
MRIGVPRERKVLEGRVGLVPDACAELVRDGHAVYLERGAGVLSGFDDAAYRDVGAQIAADASVLYRSAELIVKVKEPTEPDLSLLRPEHRLFCYLHLAANAELAERLCRIGLTAVAFETVEAHGGLPLLAPMSEIAGRLAVQIGTQLLHHPQGGKGVLLGGLPGVERGRVVILGAGVAGGSAAAAAAALGAEVTVFDRVPDKLARMRALGANVNALYAYGGAVRQAVTGADLLIGAVLVTGRRAPHVVDAATVGAMASGSVVMDISVDQGGCIETTRATDYENPTYLWEGIVHFAVTNMPGAVPRSASQALSAALIPYVRAIAREDWETDPVLRAGVNVQRGVLVHPALID